MRQPNIALLGRARSGKDSFAARLVQAHGYTRVAFADALKDVALAADPYIGPGLRLSDVVDAEGWGGAKDRYPEVRRVLQDFGHRMRETDPDVWLRIALAKIESAKTWGMPVVVTDCRYENEADALAEQKFMMIHVTRPGLADDPHPSENELSGYLAHWHVQNDGTLADLEKHADWYAYRPH